MDTGIYTKVTGSNVIDLILGPTGTPKQGNDPNHSVPEDAVRALGSLHMIGSQSLSSVTSVQESSSGLTTGDPWHSACLPSVSDIITSKPTLTNSSEVMEKVEISPDGAMKHNISFKTENGSDQSWIGVDWDVNKSQSSGEYTTVTKDHLIPENMIKQEVVDIEGDQDASFVTKGEINVNKYDCDICGRVYRRLIDLTNHKQEQHIKTYPCEICGQKFHWIPDLTRHLHDHMEQQLPELPASSLYQEVQVKSEPEAQGNKKYKCEFCAEGFDWMPDLTRHMQDHANQFLPTLQPKGKLHKCAVCEQEFTRKGALTNHMKSHITKVKKQRRKGKQKKVGVTLFAKSKIHKCTECGESFSEERLLHWHMRCHKDASSDSDVALENENGTDFDQEYKNDITDELTQESLEKNKEKFTCMICNRTFKNINKLSSHTKVHTGDMSFSCNVCDKSFRRKFHLKKHKIMHKDNEKKSTDHPKNEKVFSCNQCEKAYARSYDLKVHQRSHSGVRPYKCDICDKTYMRKQHLNDHRNVHIHGKPFSCEVCNKGFFAKIRLLAHKCSGVPVSEDRDTSVLQKPRCTISTEEEQSLMCEICSKVFPNKYKLREHKNGVHNRPRSHVCSQCGKAYRSSSDLTAHIRRHTGDKPFLCQMCSSAFYTMSNLKNHMRTHNIGCGEFPCDSCSKVFKYADLLRKHKRRIHSQKHLCETCGLECDSVKSLKVHRRTHDNGPDGKQPCVCEFCGKGFRSQALLQYHRTIHTGERPHQCSLCGKRFRLIASLRRHQAAHTGERPHICDQCGSTFICKGDLSVHKHRFHYKKGNYKCSVCGRMFHGKMYLGLHKRRVHGDKKFKCVICNKTYTLAFVLNKHMKDVHSGESFHCTHCNQVFNRKNTLEKHEKKCKSGEVRIKKVKTKYHPSKYYQSRPKFPCPHCDATLPGVLALRTHVKCHQGYQMFNCPVCNREFAKKSNLKRHIESRHKEYSLQGYDLESCQGQPAFKKKPQSLGHETDQSLDEEFYHLTPGYMLTSLIQNILPPRISPAPRPALVLPSTSTAESSSHIAEPGLSPASSGGAEYGQMLNS